MTEAPGFRNSPAARRINTAHQEGIRDVGPYGYRRVHAASPELVRLLMRELCLVPCQPKRRSASRSPSQRPAMGRTSSAGTPPPTRPAKNPSRHSLHQKRRRLTVPRDRHRLLHE